MNHMKIVFALAIMALLYTTYISSPFSTQTVSNDKPSGIFKINRVVKVSQNLINREPADSQVADKQNSFIIINTRDIERDSTTSTESILPAELGRTKTTTWSDYKIKIERIDFLGEQQYEVTITSDDCSSLTQSYMISEIKDDRDIKQRLKALIDKQACRSSKTVRATKRETIDKNQKDNRNTENIEIDNQLIAISELATNGQHDKAHEKRKKLEKKVCQIENNSLCAEVKLEETLHHLIENSKSIQEIKIQIQNHYTQLEEQKHQLETRGSSLEARQLFNKELSDFKFEIKSRFSPSKIARNSKLSQLTWLSFKKEFDELFKNEPSPFNVPVSNQRSGKGMGCLPKATDGLPIDGSPCVLSSKSHLNKTTRQENEKWSRSNNSQRAGNISKSHRNIRRRKN